MVGSKFVKDHQLTFHGVNLKGKVKSVSPVNINSAWEKISPSGVEGVLAVRTRLEEITFAFTVYGYEEAVLARTGLHQAGAFTDVIMNWVIEDQAGIKTSVIIEAQGAVTSVDRGTVENGSLHETTVNMTLHRYKEVYNGKIVYDIDIYDGSRTNIIGGIDVARETLSILNQVGILG